MTLRFSVLASGSAGNASLVETHDTAILIDAGLGPRQLAARLATAGGALQAIRGVLLTHTHTDHWRERTFEHMRRHRIPLICHAAHCDFLEESSRAFDLLRADDLVQTYDEGAEISLSRSLRCRPVEVMHDSVPTFGFRITFSQGLFGDSWTLGYLSDLGCWTQDLVREFTHVDVLALEFNHDEQMERASRRPPELINRVLSDYGHLSNSQAAEFLSEVLKQAVPASLRHVVQLHLSRECNRPALARASMEKICALYVDPPCVHTAHQDQAGPFILFGRDSRQKSLPSRITS